MNTKTALAAVFTIIMLIVGCRREPQVEILKPPYDNPLAPGAPALRKITNPYEIPDFTLACLDTKNLRDSIDFSLTYLSKPSSQKFFPIQDITHYRSVRSLRVFGELLDSGLTGAALNQAIREKFDVYMSVGCDGQGTVLFTGYYTPIFEGSFTPSDKYRYPLYKQPPDLIKEPDGHILGRRMPDGSVTKYPSRAEIEQTQMLNGNELIYLSDPFEVYIAHVQGSAKIRLPDGKLETVGYAATNGHDYKSITTQMINDGAINKSQLSLGAMIEHFKKNPDQVAKYTQINPRFVFFLRQEGDPRGSLNVPVTAYRSIATDKSIFPRGAMTFISTSLPQEQGGQISNRIYSGFALDQDTGGAIRAPGRCDVYMGIGDMAGRLAGQTYQEGKLYYLFLKPSADIVHY